MSRTIILGVGMTGLAAKFQAWVSIEGVEVADPTRIEVAFTCSWPDSPWTQQAIDELKK